MKHVQQEWGRMFELGRIIVPKSFENTPLHSGSGYYSHGICVSADPFVLVSEEGDMLWTQLDPNQFCQLGMADDKVIKIAKDRYKSHIYQCMATK